VAARTVGAKVIRRATRGRRLGPGMKPAVRQRRGFGMLQTAHSLRGLASLSGLGLAGFHVCIRVVLRACSGRCSRLELQVGVLHCQWQ
jgi:hypothetical protein